MASRNAPGSISAACGRMTAPIAIERYEEVDDNSDSSHGRETSIDPGNGSDSASSGGDDYRNYRGNNRINELGSSFDNRSGLHRQAGGMSFSVPRHQNGSMAFSLSEAQDMQRHEDMLRAMGHSSGRASSSRRGKPDRKLGGSIAHSMPAPRAPFLSSRCLKETDQRLSSIPSMALPESVASSSWTGSDVGGGFSVPYGSLRGSSFQSRHMHSRQNKDKSSKANSPQGLFQSGKMAHSLPGSSYTSSQPVQSQHQQELHSKHQPSGIGFLVKDSTLNTDLVATGHDPRARLEEEECKRHDSSSQESAFQSVCDQMNGFQLDESESESDGQFEAGLRFGQSLTALGVMEFTRANKQQQNTSRDKVMAQSLKEDQMRSALQEWASRSYQAKSGPMGLLSLSSSDGGNEDTNDGVSTNSVRKMSDIMEASRPSSLKSSSLTEAASSADIHSQLHFSDQSKMFLLEQSNSDESDAEGDGDIDDNPDTFEAFDFELE